MKKSKLNTAILLILLISTNIKAQSNIMLNQVGYLPGAKKYVFVTEKIDSFYVINSETGKVAFKNKLILWIENDPSTGMTVYRGDFSDLKTSGNFYVQMPGKKNSYEFTIGNSVYDATYRKSVKAFYYLRCGTELKPEFGGEFIHPECHKEDAFFHPSTGKEGQIDATGGWHDAGDYGKYVVNASITVGTMLMAYELFPENFNQDDNAIPGSGNNIPDILDEIRYELEWMLKMQSSNGGVHHKLTRENFSPFIMPQEDKEKRFILEITTTATGDFAAVMAKAARVYSQFDKNFSAKCLAAAKNAWQFLENHPEIVPPGGFHNPEGIKTGEYDDKFDWDERLWAAAELFVTTGEKVYNDYFKNHYDQHVFFTPKEWWRYVNSMAHLSYLKGEQKKINKKVQQKIRAELLKFAQELLEKRNSSGFHFVLKQGEFIWGSNSDALNQAILLIMAYEETKNQEFFDAAFDQLHYVLGANAHNLSFVTGAGINYSMRPHFRPAAADGIDEPIPGFLIGGANQNLQDPVMQARFNKSTPPALCYIDEVGSYASNEIAINWNAALVFILGYFNGEK